MCPDEKPPTIEIHPQEIKGEWDTGYVLDVHTISSTMIGYNEFGHPEFETQRSSLRELVYRLKYRKCISVSVVTRHSREHVASGEFCTLFRWSPLNSAELSILQPEPLPPPGYRLADEADQPHNHCDHIAQRQ